MKRNRIIVLVDLSDDSENLIDFAFSLSDVIFAKMIFVHQIAAVAPGMADHEGKAEIIRIEKEEANSKLWKLTKGKAYNADSFHISKEPILTTLEELKTDHYFDWVLAGLKGSGILKRLFIGSSTLSVVNNSSLMTIAVPVQKPITVPKKLLVGVDQKYEMNKPQFTAMLSALAGQVEEVEFFTILKDNEDEQKANQYLNHLHDEFKAYNSSTLLFKGKDVFTDLKHHVDQTEDAFLVLQQGSRSLQDYIFRKFMINELVYTGLIPLIVISK